MSVSYYSINPISTGHMEDKFPREKASNLLIGRNGIELILFHDHPNL